MLQIKILETSYDFILKDLSFKGTIKKTGENKQVLDRLEVERERGITVKAVSVMKCVYDISSFFVASYDYIANSQYDL